MLFHINFCLTILIFIVILINNIDHIISVLNNNNIDISEMKLHKQIADYYNKKAFSIMRDIDKTARKNNKKDLPFMIILKLDI